MMGDFNLVLVIMEVVVSILVLLASIYLLVNYQHPNDVNQAYFSKLVVVLGLSIAAISILMLPADIANRQACRHAIYNGTCNLTLPMKTLWLAIYITDVVLVFFVIPFAMFYDEGSSSLVGSDRQRCGSDHRLKIPLHTGLPRDHKGDQGPCPVFLYAVDEPADGDGVVGGVHGGGRRAQGVGVGGCTVGRWRRTGDCKLWSEVDANGAREGDGVVMLFAKKQIFTIFIFLKKIILMTLKSVVKSL